MSAPTSAPRNIRHALKSWIPNWLSDRQNLRTGYWILYTIAKQCDTVVEAMYQGFLAALPTRGTPTALPYIGAGRNLIRGLLETDTQYGTRLQAWLTIWQNAGAAETLAQYIQTYLGNNLVVRVIDRAGNFVTANADGTTTFVADPTWNWDTVRNPERIPWFADIWIVIYLTDGRFPAYTSFTDPNWIAAWGTYQGFGSGFQIPRSVVDDIDRIVADFKGAHNWVEAIIWTTNTTLFEPGALGGNPDGQWANWGTTDGSNNEVNARIYISSGNRATRYRIPVIGG